MAVATDPEGKYSEVLTLECKTAPIQYNDIKVSLVLEKNDPGNVVVSVAAEGAVDYLYWIGRVADNVWKSPSYLGGSAAKAQQYMYANASHERFANVKAAYPVVDGKITMTDLTPNTNYVIVAMAKDKDGLYSEAAELRFTPRSVAIGNVVLSSDPEWKAAEPVIEWIPEAFEPTHHHIFHHAECSGIGTGGGNTRIDECKITIREHTAEMIFSQFGISVHFRNGTTEERNCTFLFRQEFFHGTGNSATGDDVIIVPGRICTKVIDHICRIFETVGVMIIIFLYDNTDRTAQCFITGRKDIHIFIKRNDLVNIAADGKNGYFCSSQLFQIVKRLIVVIECIFSGGKVVRFLTLDPVVINIAFTETAGPALEIAYAVIDVDGCDFIRIFLGEIECDQCALTHTDQSTTFGKLEVFTQKIVIFFPQCHGARCSVENISIQKDECKTAFQQSDIGLRLMTEPATTPYPGSVFGNIYVSR